MNSILRNVLAVIAGLVTGSIVNMALIMLGSYLIPAPDGTDTTTMAGIKASIHLFSAKHFIFPFLAHAGGTLVGAILAAKISLNRSMLTAMMVSVFFLAGGIANALMIPAPQWFIVLDLILAYMPMGWLGAKIFARK